MEKFPPAPLKLTRTRKWQVNYPSMNKILRKFDRPWPDLDGKSILVTGGSGSFGHAFVRIVLENFKPSRLIVFSRDEMKQYEMAQLFDTARHPCMRYFIGDVRDIDRLEMAMQDVDIVIHAAALKHVPIAEYNPFECINTNVVGAENVVKAAIRTKVGKVIALSTDKAVNPINIYGASKLASDKIFVAANQLAGANGASFAVVRYGNVIGSRGSVVPLYRKLIGSGAATLPITDPLMTRFWITLRQGVNFVLSSLEMMAAGEIFVPKIPSMKMVDLARSLAPDLELETIGIRPGEKLHEMLITEDDARSTLELEDRFVITPSFFPGDEKWRAHESSRVSKNFRYASDDNSEWLDADSLVAMLEDH